MISKIKISRNPFFWLAFMAVALNIYAHFTTTSIPLITYLLIGSVFIYSFSNDTLSRLIGSNYSLYSISMIAYVILMMAFSPEASSGMSRMIIFQIALCLCFFMFLCASNSSENVIIVMIALAVSALCVTILTDPVLFETLSETNEDGGYYTLEENNRNTIGIILSIGAIFMLYLGVAKSKWWFLAMVVTVSLGLLTGSRKVVAAVLVGIMAFSILYARCFKEQNLKKGIKIIFISVLLILLLLFLCFNIDVLYNIIGSRIEGMLQTIVGAGEGEASARERFAMLEKAFDMFLEKPLFGWGIEGFAEYSGFGVYSHNNYTETLVSFGILGFVAFYLPKIALVVFQIQTMNEKKKSNDVLINIALITVMLVVFVLDFGAISMNSLVVNLPFAMSAAYLYQDKRERAENDENCLYTLSN